MASSRVGRALTSARERAGMSREALAHRAGLSWAAIAQIESGRRQEIRLSTLVSLAGALGITVDYLASGACSPNLLGHRAVIYGADDQYVAATVPFLREGISRSDTVMTVTAKRHTDLLREALGDEAAQVEFLDASEWYRSLNGVATGYRALLRERFERGAPWVRVVAEPVWSGWSDTRLTQWIRYESLINLSLASCPATIVCTYDSRAVPDAVLTGAQHTHPEVGPADGARATGTYRAPEDFLLGTI